MKRWILGITLLCGFAAGAMTPSTFAQDASPVASPAVGDRPLDLPAMVLLPSDLDESGYGAGRAEFQSAEAQAGFTAMYSGLGNTEVLEGLRSAGFVRRYTVSLEQPVPERDAIWLAEQAEPSLATPGSGFVDVAEVSEAGTAGEESRVFSYGYPLDDLTTSRGYAV